MPGIKEVIEQFHDRFKDVNLRFSFPSEGHDLLDDDYGPGSTRIHEEDADIDRIMAEYLRLPWYPGKEYYPDQEGTEEEERADCKQQEERLIEALAQFDLYYADKRRIEAEANQMSEEQAREHRRKFNQTGKAKYPLLERIDCFTLGEALERLPKAIDRKTFISTIHALGEWGDSPGPCYIETLKENQARHREEERKSLEDEAGRLASQMGVVVGSMRFIHGLHRLLGRHRDRRQGLREDGLCATAYPGTYRGVEQWYEMNDDIGNDIAHVHRIIGWLKTNCPLLWCQYQEWRRRRRCKKGGKR